MFIRRRWFLLWTIVLVSVLMLTHLAYQVVDILRVWASSHSEVPVGSVSLVLGDELEDGKVGPHFRQRLDKAIELYQRGMVRTILVSGGGQSPEALQGKDYLVTRGIPTEHIFTEIHSCSTYENIANSKAILEVEGLKEPVALITNGFHLRRALTIARIQGLQVYGVAAEANLSMANAAWASLLREAAAQSVQAFWVSPVSC